MAIRKRKSDLPEYGVKIRLYPTLVQQAKLRQFFGNDRFLWNQLVSLYQGRYKNNKSLKLLTEFDLNNLLPALKNEYPIPQGKRQLQLPNRDQEHQRCLGGVLCRNETQAPLPLKT